MTDRHGDNISLRQIAALTVVPLLMFCLAIALKAHYGAYYLGLHVDPEYAYLLNSLNILHFVVPGHTDHPGTTLQVLGGVVLLVKWLAHPAGVGHTGIDEFVLRNPEQSLAAINLALNLLVLAAFIFASLTVYRCIRSMLPVLVFQISMLVPLQIKLSLLRVSPEPLLLSSVLLAAALVVRYCHSDPGDPRTSRAAILVGMVMGFGMATKVTFLPILLLLLLFRSRKEVLAGFGTSVFSFLLFTLPISAKFVQMLGWFASIAAHSGQYGQGRVGVPTPGDLLANLISLMKQEPSFFVFLGFYLAYLAAKRRLPDAESGPGTRFLAVGSMIMALQLLLTIKHPGVHYMLPAIAMTPFLNAQSFFLPGKERFAGHLGAVVCTAALVALSYAFVSTKGWASTRDEYRLSDAALSRRLGAMDGAVVIPYYRASGMEYALAFGNSFAGRRYCGELSRIYPGAVFYDMWKRQFHTYGNDLGPTDVKALLKKGPVLLVGAPLGAEDKLPEQLEVVPLIENRPVSVYRLRETR